MTFAARITRQPVAFDPELGAEALAQLPDMGSEVNALFHAVAGCSPYLKGLMAREGEWISAAMADPEAAVAAEHAILRETAPDQLPDALRRGKRRIALLSGVADCGGVWQLEQVTGALTDYADLAVHLALRATIGAEIKRGKLPGAVPEDAERAGGMVALAMGKMGAGELNYSSDVDLICLFDETQFDRDDYHDARASFVRATRRMSTMLSDLTAEGYVFRTDLRLRPDPAVTPVCMAMAAAETYYESLGRTWERAAYIKARPCAGDLEAGARFLHTLRPFVWRKHLDFAAIQDAHDMRLRIREHKGLGGALDLAGHNMKLGRGGIREIEFFTQTRQLIAGGRDTDLRVRGTVPGLSVLADKGWITPEAAEKLTNHYRFHRTVEHRVQMVNDAQTHALPTSPENMQRLACFLGRDRADLEVELRQRLEEVHGLTEEFFAPDAADPRAIEEEVRFDPEVIRRWASYPAFRSSRAVEIFERIKPRLFGQLQRSAKPEEALIALDGFLSGLPAGVQLLSLFEANPQLIDLLVDIVGTSPSLATYISRNSGVFDAVIGGSFFADWPGRAALTEELVARLAADPDYEHKLDQTRRWSKEWRFRIGVHHLRGLISGDEAAEQYAELAEATLAALFPAVLTQFALKHGDQPGRGATILGMGSLGAGRLNANSDLDLIVVYDADGVEFSEGRKPLAARTYYAKLTQAMVTAVTAQMPQGRLYEIDMRLRPSGTQGPVATSLTSFRDYQMGEAWTWEHLALSRARAVAGSTEVADDVEAVRRDVLGLSREIGTLFSDVSDMRDRIAAAKGPAGPWDAKVGAGRLQDIELLSQALVLATQADTRSTRDGLVAAAATGVLGDEEKERLLMAHDLCWTVQMVNKLISNTRLDPQDMGEGGREMLLREASEPTLDVLEARLVEVTAEAAAVIETVLQRNIVAEGAM
ncbi:glutamine-synthetase adenylyltransferase [Thalassobius sp. Cn5-15]|uniref:[protein-PII] uridylyltransferase family protein n=1 Tax=Thalassobius sp. Cn5-15 TaxID=2917763 RepID=UPI001EF36633|nr:glutamine-synthetase adenylyltransferase [Thalassobius sp. Cn5-15]MCG7492060.1 glutamine-synthetase adenylyltransferase [Thalassobius sp. Cn5-15]